jgi:zinc protease
LAYTVTANISMKANDQPGLFLGYIGTFPDKLLWVRDGFLKEIERLRNEPPSEQEVEDVKKYLLGSLAFKVTSNSQLAEQLLIAERYQLGFHFLDRYRQEIAAVTPAMVQAAARKHLRPEHLTVVAVGAVDADGKPLRPATKER